MGPPMSGALQVKRRAESPLGKLLSHVAGTFENEAMVAIRSVGIALGEGMVDKHGQAELVGRQQRGIECGVFVGAHRRAHPYQHKLSRGLATGARTHPLSNHFGQPIEQPITRPSLLVEGHPAPSARGKHWSYRRVRTTPAPSHPTPQTG